ncbi:MAG: cytochrome d ubiquinol oxidase subunit II [Alphaproteobacteria bacterium]|nr:cytochrome d ubiquinol oxidase subunit II [Alphaproteobacteria bacterium]
MLDILAAASWLPLAFFMLLVLAFLVYVLLDGYDLGVGILSWFAKSEEQEIMLASIAPFWDANETWLVLTVGLLLVAFPAASGVILTELYLPVFVMLCGLIGRGVALEFRHARNGIHKKQWTRVFAGASLLVALAQGYMLGAFMSGFEDGFVAHIFYIMVGIGFAFAYALMGSAWLLMKTQGQISGLFGRLPYALKMSGWKAFAVIAGIFVFMAVAAAYSIYPHIVPGQLTLEDAAAAPESLAFIFAGAIITVPLLLAASVYSYVVFHGNTKELYYN